MPQINNPKITNICQLDNLVAVYTADEKGDIEHLPVIALGVIVDIINGAEVSSAVGLVVDEVDILPAYSRRGFLGYKFVGSLTTTATARDILKRPWFSRPPVREDDSQTPFDAPTAHEEGDKYGGGEGGK